MARCKECIHSDVCDMWAVVSGIPFVNADTCEYFKSSADVVPKSEVEYWKEQCFHACMSDGGLDRAVVDAFIARVIFAEIEFEIRQLDFNRDETRAIAIEGIIAAAKKKYTEDQSGG